VIGLLVNPNNPNAEPDTKATEAAARVFGQKLLVVKAANDGEVEAAFAALANERVGALCVNIEPFLFRVQKQIISPAWFANDLSTTRVRPSRRGHELQPKRR
jgi:ABC-type uncharacterized transport system substrate-binding protein